MTWTAPAVDRPNSPNVAPEREAAEGLLDYHRATLLWKCAGLTGEQLATRAVPPSSMSLLGLVRHMADVERSWFRRRVAGEQIEQPALERRQPGRRLRRPRPGRGGGRLRGLRRRGRGSQEGAGAATTSTTPSRCTHSNGTEETIDIRALDPAHDRGVRPAQRPRRPAPRGDRRLDRRLTSSSDPGGTPGQRRAGDQPGLAAPPQRRG